MPFTYTEQQRNAAKAIVLEGLRKGTPLTVICSGDGMPCDNTVRDWAEADAQFGSDIARARETGFDQIALDALAIADETKLDTVKGRDGAEIANTEWISRSKLRVETRLKLLAKWDPKRYGELVKVGNADGSNLDTAASIAAARERAGLE